MGYFLLDFLLFGEIIKKNIYNYGKEKKIWEESRIRSV